MKGFKIKAAFENGGVFGSGGFNYGPKGADGVSPTVELEAIEGGHRLSIKDVQGMHSFNIMDGIDGVDGTGIGDMLMSVYDPQGKGEPLAAESELSAHAENSSHISAAERSAWNSKAETADLAVVIDGLADHMEDGEAHISESERSAWNAKAETAAIPLKLSQLENDSGYLSDISAIIGRSSAVTAADSGYGSLMARGAKLMSAADFDAVDNWSGQLVNGALAWRYE